MSDLLKSTRGRIGAGAAGLVVVLVAAWFGLVAPKRDKASDLRAQTEVAYAELAQKKAALAHPAARVTIRARDGYLLGKALPDTVDMPSTLLDVERLAKRHRLGFTAFTPSPATAGFGYDATPMDLTLQGRFDRVSAFLGQLRRGVRVERGRLVVTGPIYSITKVDVGAPDAPAVFPIVKARVTISSFTYNPGPAAAPPGAGGTPSTSGGNATVAAGATP